MARSLDTDPAAWRYRTLIGTGGIGSGTFFALKGDHTLGREESRAGRFLDRRDYCKLHIIEHYIQALLGDAFRTVPVGKVGDDTPGRQMIAEMQEAGLSVEHVEIAPGQQTLYSICFVYPDGAGGNLTVDDSASEHVDAASIRRSEPEFARFAGAGITLAAPEVPLAARAELLRLGRQYGFLNTASFTSGELRAAGLPPGGTGSMGSASTGTDPRTSEQSADGTLVHEMLEQLDFLALNIDEAAALAGLPADASPHTIVQAATETLAAIQPKIRFSITAGKHGSWTWDGRSRSFAPTYTVPVAGTAGAGDSFFAGMIVGIVAGLSLPEAQQLATLVAACKVTCIHTIHKQIDRDTLRTFAASVSAPLADAVRRLLEG